MHEVTIKPQWTIRQSGGTSLAPRVIELLVKVHEQGSLASACRDLGVSYRHAWELVRQGETLFGAPLVVMVRGKGTELTPLGEKLVWADHCISARLSPLLHSLASELRAEIGKVLAQTSAMLRIHASHGFAIEALHELLASAGTPNELKYCGSGDALVSLHHGGCDLAGFHVPLGEFESAAIAQYSRWLSARSQRLIHMATRRQGLIVAGGNPKKIYSLRDLGRSGVRFINRQAGSGTRIVFDAMLHKDGIDAGRIKGYEQCEFTHAAVAAYVASDMADAGYGIETPARMFKLDFIPGHSERYFLLCDEKTLQSPAVRTMLALLASTQYKDAVNRLPGYQADGSGSVMTLDEAFVSMSAA